ncbi:hypothetical protein U9M48_008224 [Paspalum notatum var. saurae]|uniref:Cysteine-rich receptor-like protein kinase 10 n=1 Tax=Paspalum notatum var. saurae TaxID=547442 RepID=A0AAQ3SP50_PASNO
MSVVAAGGSLLLLLAGLTPFVPAAADVCDNVKQVAATLPKSTSSSPLHFATTTVGQAPDVIYALALCRGDVLNDSTCGDCVAGAFDSLQKPQCSTSDQYYGNDNCMLAYSTNNDILAPSNGTAPNNGDEAPYMLWNIINVTGDAATVRLMVGLIHEMLVETVQAASSAAPRRFATGSMDSDTTFPTMYSMAQCTPDLSASDCLVCLQGLLGMVNSTMALRMGGRIHVIRCYFRYEAYVFYSGEPMIRVGPSSVKAPGPTPAKHKRRMSKLWAIPIVVVPLAAVALLCFSFYSPWFRRYRKGKAGSRLQAGLRRTQDLEGQEELVWDGKNSEFSVFDFKQVLDATDNFSEENKLGQGGFGAVYKGQFDEGLAIAVKRLASHSGQGFTEFKNEVQLIAKLQHRNLVRLLGCCSQEEEKILVYEYLPNKSLDFFIFDDSRRALLDWSKLLVIIEGIAHGLLYLHKHSRLRVIHRDLKPSNILLDGQMNPKISDFGLAKIFSSNNNERNTTQRVVGTYGYMAPEYASEGIFSIKSDVFSFGVLVLEILSGKRNSGSHQCGDFVNFIGYAWQLWEERRWIDLVDASLLPNIHSEEMMRCINIALLCVQENATDRPTMADVVAMLSAETTTALAEPKQPAYFNVRVGNEEASTTVTKTPMAGVLLILLCFLLVLPSATAIGQTCGNAGNYTANSTYQSNLASLIATLRNNTSSLPLLFATATAGRAPNAVYGLALCRGDITTNLTGCSTCISGCFQYARKMCPFDKAASIYDDNCLLGFSNNKNILSQANNITQDMSTFFQFWNQQVIAGNATLVTAAVHGMLTQTAQVAATNTPRLFATTVMDASGNAMPTTLYSMAQCTPDLSAADCQACLQQIIGLVNATLSVRLGGRVLLLRCNIRYENILFYEGTPMKRITASSTPPAPTPLPPTTNKQSNNMRLGQKRTNNLQEVDKLEWEMEAELSEFSVFDFHQILEATDNFSDENKLGEGGFGPVYKGQFPDGTEIAVKRLASHSGQGFIEFKNEVELIAKLQHTNLVRLLGCCSQGEEKILVYEYLPNKSLDFFIFDEDRKSLLDWSKRLVIIQGIAEGLLYLHKHSRLRVIHRDLKPSNILLDSEMNPKISDFGLAKIFSTNNNEGSATRRVVGTYGYMAPEYASEGLFSIKSDVFSFGVLILEILSGKRNSGSNDCGDFINILGYAWQLYDEGRWSELVDASLEPMHHSAEMMRCMNIGLLCVQEIAADRPTMLDVVAMLSSKTKIVAEPKHPAYFNVRVGNEEASTTATESCSINQMTISVATELIYDLPDKPLHQILHRLASTP